MKSYQEIEKVSEEQLFIDTLGSTNASERYQTVRKIRNILIGMKCKKSSFVKAGIIQRLLDLMVEEDASVDFAVEATVILGSLARGNPENVKLLIDSDAIRILWKGLCHHNDRLVMACLRSLSICYTTSDVPSSFIYEDANVISKLIYLLTVSSQTAEYATNILKKSCKSSIHQLTLYDADVVSALKPWLNNSQSEIFVPVLECFSSLVHGNEVVANEIMEGDFGGISVKNQIFTLISADRPDAVQLAAAECLTNALCASTSDHCGIYLQRKILSVFVRMCQKEKPLNLRISAANSLAYLIEEDKELQTIASISNHLIKNIASLFSLGENINEKTKDKAKEAAFKVYAALSANEEKVRKQIVNTCSSLMPCINEAINQGSNISLQAAALQCVLSLSRSVQQLRTTFQDVKIWQPVITALKTSTSDDIISVASSVLCNLLLDFSPYKEALIDFGALDVLVVLMQRDEIPLKVNGVWGIMNLAYDASDSLKNKIVQVTGIQNILDLLGTSHVDVVVKTLGILRNLLTEKEEDIDNLMKAYGKDIMTAVRPLTLDDTLNERIKEQVLCLLSNIANGCFSKDILMEDSILIKKVIEYITSEREQLQVASVFCVTNLMRSSEGDRRRQAKLRELGAEKQLQTLLTSTNSNLFDRVKQALQQFT